MAAFWLLQLCPVVKQELVLSCLQPGVSIAREACAHGVNANLQRNWIHHYKAAVADHKADETLLTFPAFVPVVPQSAKPKTTDARLTIKLVNGVQLTLQSVDFAELSPLLNTLADLPCYASSWG